MSIILHSAHGQQLATAGTEFYTYFPGGTGTYARACICALEYTQGSIFFYKTNVSQNFTIEKDSCLFILNNTNVFMGGTLYADTVGLRINTLSNVVVNSFSHGIITGGMISNLVYPIHTIGNFYVASAYWYYYNNGNKNSWIGFGGVEDNTEIKFINTAAIPKTPPPPIPPGTINYFTTHEGHTFSIETNQNDLTGTTAESVNGENFIFHAGRWGLSGGSNNYGWKNGIATFQIPVNKWSKNYHSVPFLTRLGGDEYRILAAHDTTEIFINGSYITTLNYTQYFDTTISVASKFSSNKPFSVHQISRDNDKDSVLNAAAFMFPLMGDETIFTKAVFASDIVTDTNGVINSRYINIVAKTNHVNFVTLDGASVASNFIQFPNDPLWSYAQLSVTPGIHIIQADSGAKAYYYAYGYITGYGHVIGGVNELITGIGEIESNKPTIKIYPNPVRDVLYFTLPYNEKNIETKIFDAKGKEVLNTSSNKNRIDVANLSSGLYLIKVITDNGVYNAKFLKSYD